MFNLVGVADRPAHPAPRDPDRGRAHAVPGRPPARDPGRATRVRRPPGRCATRSHRYPAGRRRARAQAGARRGASSSSTRSTTTGMFDAIAQGLVRRHRRARATAGGGARASPSAAAGYVNPFLELWEPQLAEWPRWLKIVALRRHRRRRHGAAQLHAPVPADGRAREVGARVPAPESACATPQIVHVGAADRELSVLRRLRAGGARRRPRHGGRVGGRGAGTRVQAR